MKTICLHIDHDSALPARLETAIGLARAGTGHIICLQAISPEVFMPGDVYGSAIAITLPIIRENADSLRAETEARLAGEGVSWEWRQRHGMAAHRLIEAAALADVVLVGPRAAGESEGGASDMVSDLVMRAAVPVLVIPQGAPLAHPAAPVLVAWNGSGEACTALRMAVPLLASAQSVFIASVAETSERKRFDVPPEEAAAYLERHGITSEVVIIEPGDARVADTLFSAAQMRGCGLMVMGAYGHSRLAQMLLGGVTRRMLSEPQMPTLLAH